MSLRTLARRLPSLIYRMLQGLERRLHGPHRVPTAIANPGPLLTGVVPRLATIPGWFNNDDLTHFTQVLETQTSSGLRGDLLEFGCYHGRSAAVFARHLQPGERLLLADACDLPLSDPLWRHGYAGEGAAEPGSGGAEPEPRTRPCSTQLQQRDYIAV